MAQMEKVRGEQSEATLFNATDWTANAKQSMDGLANAEAQLWEEVQAANQHWLDCFSAESKLGADFVSKLASAHTVPEAINVCQEFNRRQLELIAENATQFIGKSQQIMQDGARSFAKGWPAGISGIST